MYLNELLEYKDYYKYLFECEAIMIEDGPKKEQATEAYKKAIGLCFFANEDKWSLDIALGCIRNFTDEEISYVSKNGKIESFHTGFGLYVRNKYIHNSCLHVCVQADHVSSKVEKFLIGIICPTFNPFEAKKLKSLPDVLVDHYTNSKGLITRKDISAPIYDEWQGIIDKLYEQACALSRKEWNNASELKDLSCEDVIWDTIHYIYNQMIGDINGSGLPKNTDLVCLVVAYAVKKRKIDLESENLSSKDSFRLKIEHLLAREIITHRKKTTRIIEDEAIDLKYVRSLRKKQNSDFQVSKISSVRIGKGKIDFSQITTDGYEKVCLISEKPYNYERYINEDDETLSCNYVLFSFGQMEYEIYAESWARVLVGLGIRPMDKGIEFLHKTIDKRMKHVMYKYLIEEHVISPTAVIEMRFIQELYIVIKDVLDDKKIFKTSEEYNMWAEDSVLYIYKNRTSCHTRSHEMESATAIFTGKNDLEIKLNVEHCKKCGKFYMSYSVYERYREKYGILLGKIKMDSASVNEISDIVLSDFSPLRLCGYSVNQQDGYSKTERQYIISRVISKGILSKSEVVRYLEHFINRNGQKASNGLALEKWKEDLDFALKYKMSEQTEYQVKYIKRY